MTLPETCPDCGRYHTVTAKILDYGTPFERYIEKCSECPYMVLELPDLHQLRNVIVEVN